MADANMADFYDRVRRFERMRSKGYGFETPDTLGRSFYNQRLTKKSRGWVLPVVVGLVVVFGLKAGLYQAVGAASYDDRVARLQAGDGFDPVGGWMMQADPVTLWVADKMAAGLSRLQ
jgi:hypothetical protein